MATDVREAAQAVCWGELLWDLFPDGARLGGAPSNVAVHLAQLGCATALITSLGRDPLGERARRELGKRGLLVDGLQRHPRLPTGQVGIEVVDGEPSYTLHEGAWREIDCDPAADALLGGASAIVFGTLSQERACGLASWRQAMDVNPRAIKVCDPNLRGGRIDPALVREHLLAADIVKINDGELKSIETSIAKRDGIRWLLEEAQLRCIAHTHGEHGATLYTRERSATHPGYAAASGGDNVGAGDAFTAVLTLAALCQTPLASTLEAANRIGSYVASRRGATPTLPTPLLAEVHSLLGTEAGVRGSNSK